MVRAPGLPVRPPPPVRPSRSWPPAHPPGGPSWCPGDPVRPESKDASSAPRGRWRRGGKTCPRRARSNFSETRFEYVQKFQIGGGRGGPRVPQRGPSRRAMPAQPMFVESQAKETDVRNNAALRCPLFSASFRKGFNTSDTGCAPPNPQRTLNITATKRRPARPVSNEVLADRTSGRPRASLYERPAPIVPILPRSCAAQMPTSCRSHARDRPTPPRTTIGRLRPTLTHTRQL